MNLSVEDRAYMAGFVDGEGTLTSMVRSGVHGPSTTLMAILASTNPDILDWVVERWGGRIYATKSRSPKHKPVYRWQVTGSGAVELCRDILPYLRIKRRHAEILIALGDIRYDYVVSEGKTGRYVSPEKLEARVPYVNELRELNRRGA